MENISYVGLSQQMALQRQMEMTANNIANMNTPGYKAQGMLFLEYLNTIGPQTEPLSQVNNYGSYRDLSAGQMEQTFNKLDVAIQGEGYFVVQTPAGNRYTRAGSFVQNERGEIATPQGYPVLGQGQTPILLPAETTHIQIAENGTVSTENGEVGRLAVVNFDNPQLLVPVGHNLLEGNDIQATPIQTPRLTQGMIEKSNVNAVIEMNRMIEVLRQYQSTQRMLQTDHERQRNAIQKLTKV